MIRKILGNYFINTNYLKLLISYLKLLRLFHDITFRKIAILFTYANKIFLIPFRCLKI